jgi:uncharacterized protein YjdB
MKTKLFRALAAVILFFAPNASFAQAPSLGSAANYVLFTTVGPVTNSGIKHLTHLTGNVGTNSGSSTGFGNVDGQMHDGDPSSIAAATDVLSLYSQLNAAIPTSFPIAPSLGNGDTLAAGIYQYPLLTAATLNGNLYLNAAGNANAVFIIKIDGALSVGASSKVKLINGALACNVFWKVEGLVSVATGTTMRGTIVANNAAINLNVNDTLEGRALSINGTITTNAVLAYMPIGCGSALLSGPAAPALGAAASFGVFSNIGAVTSTPITYVTGDVGSNSTGTTGFDPLNVTGTIYTPPHAITAAAASDLTLAFNYLNGLATDITLMDPANFGYDLVLTPHTYNLTGAPTVLTGAIYLNAQGNPNAVFVIKLAGALSTSAPIRINLMNGAQAKNVYWKISGAANIASTSVFNGTIVGSGAIDFNTGDTLNGRALTINGAIAINGSFVTNNPPPCVASPITGAMQVCLGSTTTLANNDTGGTWSSSTPLVAAIGSSSGVVNGVVAGTAIITFISGLACQATDTVTVNAAPVATTGPGSVCVGSSILLVNTTTGGTWSSSNIATATVGSLSGMVTGVAAGVVNIMYTNSNGCSANKSVTVNPLPNSGTITGTATVCPSATTTLSNTATGGTWSTVNAATATIGSATGIVTGVSQGTTTTSYTVTNGCGTSAATRIVTVSASPNAGTITGTATTCPSGTTTLSNTTGGGTWASINTAVATIGSASGIAYGVNVGTSTISYTVTNGCGTAATTVVVTVNPTPNAGVITGTATVCPANTTTLSNTASGGSWSSTNMATAIVGSSTGIVTGITPGTTTISYTVSNSCGTAAATAIVTVNNTPNAGSISGASSVCASATISLTNGVSGGTWSSSNANATVGSTGVISGVTAGNATISYTVSNMCGTAYTTHALTVNPLPQAGTITGPSAVCHGSTITMSNTTTGGVWGKTTTNITNIGNVVYGAAVGTATVLYSVTNMCGTDVAVKAVTVNALPATPVVSIHAPASVCTGTMYQNFGTATVLPAGTTYNWTAANATVWAQGTGHKNALANFNVAGTAYVTLNTTITSTGCTVANTSIINVGNSIAQTDLVSYFNAHFVCTPNTETSYQWGYDDASTLDSTILVGEINQDYVNTTPDFINKKYWVMTSLGACMQKTYYKAPLTVQGVDAEAATIKVYPNPATEVANIEISGTVTGLVQMEISNMMGQKVQSATASGNKATINVSTLPAGSYIVTCYADGVKVTSTRFTKN